MTPIEPPKAVRTRPIADVCTQLGVPPKDWHLFGRWAGKSLTTEELDALFAYVDVMIAIRCRKAGTDLLSQLIETGVGGEDLTNDELRAVVAAMVSRAV
jgi:cytochrome P450